MGGVLGPEILVRSLNRQRIPDKFGNTWKYHSRSDRHSKIACWGILVDLLGACPLFAAHARDQKIAFGINHEMRDFQVNRKKNLDLVVCTFLTEMLGETTLLTLAEGWEIELTPEESAVIKTLPVLREGEVGSVQIALEAKACMTAHIKALPRLYDELNSSQLTIHGATDIAIAAGFAMINFSTEFISPDRNKHALTSAKPVVSKHSQPGATVRALAKVGEIRRRTRVGEEGFDALAAVVIDCRNDSSPVRLVSTPPAPAPGEILHYESMIRRVAQTYEARFASL
jgi:hypothetical protein